MYNGRRLAKPNQGTIEIRLSRHQTTHHKQSRHREVDSPQIMQLL